MHVTFEAFDKILSCMHITFEVIGIIIVAPVEKRAIYVAVDIANYA